MRFQSTNFNVEMGSLTMWGCDIVESVAVDARALQTGSQISKWSSARNAAKSIVVSEEDRKTQKKLDSDAKTTYDNIKKSNKLPPAIVGAIEAGNRLDSLDQCNWGKQLNKVRFHIHVFVKLVSSHTDCSYFSRYMQGSRT